MKLKNIAYLLIVLILSCGNTVTDSVGGSVVTEKTEVLETFQQRYFEFTYGGHTYKTTNIYTTWSSDTETGVIDCIMPVFEGLKSLGFDNDKMILKFTVDNKSVTKAAVIIEDSFGNEVENFQINADITYDKMSVNAKVVIDSDNFTGEGFFYLHLGDDYVEGVTSSKYTLTEKIEDLTLDNYFIKFTMNGNTYKKDVYGGTSSYNSNTGIVNDWGQYLKGLQELGFYYDKLELDFILRENEVDLVQIVFEDDDLNLYRYIRVNAEIIYDNDSNDAIVTFSSDEISGTAQVVINKEDKPVNYINIELLNQDQSQIDGKTIRILCTNEYGATYFSDFLYEYNQNTSKYILKYNDDKSNFTSFNNAYAFIDNNENWKVDTGDYYSEVTGLIFDGLKSEITIPAFNSWSIKQ